MVEHGASLLAAPWLNQAPSGTWAAEGRPDSRAFRPHTSPKGPAPPWHQIDVVCPSHSSPKVAVTLPDVRGRQEILDLYLAGKPVAADVDTGAREALCLAAAAAGGLGGEPRGRYVCARLSNRSSLPLLTPCHVCCLPVWQFHFSHLQQPTPSPASCNPPLPTRPCRAAGAAHPRLQRR